MKASNKGRDGDANVSLGAVRVAEGREEGGALDHAPIDHASLRNRDEEGEEVADMDELLGSIVCAEEVMVER